MSVTLVLMAKAIALSNQIAAVIVQVAGMVSPAIETFNQIGI